MTARLALLLVTVVGLTASLVGQTTRLVPSQYPTIQIAIAAAASGDTIMVAPGTYNETISYLGKDLVVMSSMGPGLTTIRGSYSGRVVTMGSSLTSAAVLDGFTIKNGDGGILMDGNSATVRNCIVRDNQTTGNWGGAGILIVCPAGVTMTPSVTDCAFIGNHSDESGGGVFVDLYPGTASPSTCFATIQGCSFIANYAQGTYINSPNQGSPPPYQHNGGGGLAARSLDSAATLSLVVTDCDFNYNSSASGGAAMCLDGVDSATITGCRMFGNAGGSTGWGSGGAIFFNTSNATMKNCVVAGNSNPSSSGAIGTRAASGQTFSLDISNCTIADNFAPSCGGISVSSAGTTTIRNCIFWGNFSLDVVGSGYTASYCDFQWAVPNSSPANVSVDPLFVDPGAHDYHLSRHSPLRDAGDPFTTIGGASDIDGDARLIGARIDVGADEIPAAPLDGSGEDLELHTFTAASGDPNKTNLALAPGDILFVRLASAGGGFIGANPLIVGQPFTTGSPPTSPPGLPGIHLDGFMLQVVYGSTANGFLLGPGLPPEGVLLAYGVPPGLSGFSFRLQGFAVTPLAANGAYAVTEAHDLDF